MREITSSSLAELVMPAVSALGYELWGVVVQRNKGSVLIRIYIDHQDGITVDDCEAVSHQVNGALAVSGSMPASSYTLEVSSPGLDRPLFTLEQYKRFVGQEIKVKTKMPLQQQRNFQGKLQAITGENVVLLIADQEIVLKFSNIERGNIVPSFSR